MERKIGDIVDTLKYGMEHDRKCTLLIGAGCSVSAGIPTADGIVEYIRGKFPRAYLHAEEKTYPFVMAELTPDQRRDIISHYIDKAKLNLAHIAIGELVSAGCVDHILTTNFDPLIMRACALAGVFPAVYVFPTSQAYETVDFKQRGIFHLHGQRWAFKLLHSSEEVDTLYEDLIPMFRDAGKHHTWIVVGYSGYNDPVFTHLIKVPRFEYNLYWVGHEKNQPGTHVTRDLLDKKKRAYLISDYNADDFFVKLAEQLGCYPPNLFERPFTHLLKLLEMISTDLLPGHEVELELINDTREQVLDAIKRYESEEPDAEDQAQP